MAIGWMTVLKLVPWADVIRNAPAVADGARKLWDAVGRQPATTALTDDDVDADGQVRLSPARQLQQRLTDAEAAIATLHEQMQASSALIKALAEQNSELIRRAETNRVRVLWLAGLVVMFGAIAGLNLAVTLSHAA
jgi:hypothetical protein